MCNGRELQFEETTNKCLGASGKVRGSLCLIHDCSGPHGRSDNGATGGVTVLDLA